MLQLRQIHGFALDYHTATEGVAHTQLAVVRLHHGKHLISIVANLHHAVGCPPHLHHSALGQGIGAHRAVVQEIALSAIGAVVVFLVSSPIHISRHPGQHIQCALARRLDILLAQIASEAFQRGLAQILARGLHYPGRQKVKILRSQHPPSNCLLDGALQCVVCLLHPGKLVLCVGISCCKCKVSNNI